MGVEERFLTAFSSCSIDTRNRALVAFSGGGDSAALLLLCACLPETVRPELHAARVKHGIRSDKEESEEIRFCRDLCRRYGIPFVSLENTAEGPVEIARKQGCGPEQAAREYRIALLEEHRRAIGAEYILMGHTADDLVETHLMRLFYGSGPEGLRGIPAVRGAIRRPLLEFSREELRRYLKEQDVGWKEDATNSRNDYLRNRVRNELIPLLDRLFAGWRGGLETSMERSGEAAAALEILAERLIPEVMKEGAVRWSREDWNGCPAYLKALALWKAMDAVDESDVPDRRIPWSTVKAARRAVDDGRAWKASGFSLNPDGTSFRLESDLKDLAGRLLITRDEAECGIRVDFGGLMVEAGPAGGGGTGERWAVYHSDWPLEVDFRSTGPEIIIEVNALGSRRRIRPCRAAGTEPYRAAGTEPCRAAGTEPCRAAGTGRGISESITEKSSAGALPDADDNINYIYVRTMKAGRNA